MSFSGQLNDLSLGELIEFFCNQRKTGRLKVEYALAPGVFFICRGELVDAKVGALNGTDAVYFALTLPSASFDFNAGMTSTRHTINDPWARVVLEGLRRLDEGILPNMEAAFSGDEDLDEAFNAYLECIPEGEQQADEPAKNKGDSSAAASAAAAATAAPAPFSMMVDATTGDGGNKKKFMMAGAAAAVVLVCLVIAIPVTRSLRAKPVEIAPAAATTATPPPAPQPAENISAQTPATNEANPAKSEQEEAAAQQARREREAKEREARLKAKREEEAKKAEAAKTLTASAPTSGAKSVRVSIAYDENGRVTQASAVGTSAGAEAYAATAVRIARGRRFPAGKAGSTVVTIPIN